MRHDAVQMDTQTPPDNNGVFDGDSFKEIEFGAWLGTVYTYPRIKLRSQNRTNLKARLKAMSRYYSVRISLKDIDIRTVELTFTRFK